METKVLKVLMKLQSALTLLSEKGIHSDLSANCKEHGSMTLSVYTNNEDEENAARSILNEYKEKDKEIIRYCLESDVTGPFVTNKIHYYITELQD